MKETITQTLLAIYESLRYSVKDISIFPGENLKGVLKFATLVTVISFFVNMFLPDFSFLDYRGAALGTCLLAIIYMISFKERGDENGENNDDGVLAAHQEESED